MNAINPRILSPYAKMHVNALPYMSDSPLKNVNENPAWITALFVKQTVCTEKSPLQSSSLGPVPWAVGSPLAARS